MKRSLIGVILLVSSGWARAEVDPALARDIEQRALGAVSGADARSEAETSALAFDEEDQIWYLRNFLLRFRIRVGWSLPGLVNLAVVPEMEFVWQRPFPEGWSTYKPPAPTESGR